ncbi:MAG: hypothetical protein ABSC22_20880 [Roseiarcus sp.]|jgi:hypothetical protein
MAMAAWIITSEPVGATALMVAISAADAAAIARRDVDDRGEGR